MKALVKEVLRRFGYRLVPCVAEKARVEPAPLPDLSGRHQSIMAAARPFTMTSDERMAALIDAVTYVAVNHIPGDIVECGVWRGGSMMIVALTLLAHGDTGRSLYLYDTYEGMSEPTDEDRSFDGVSARAQLDRDPRGTGIWCHATLEDVRANLLSTGYPPEKLHFIKGKIEETIPAALPPAPIALLRLDTDWYESTKHELTHLYPLLTRKGVLLIDDYGHWQGARKAVDEYFSAQPERPYLHRIDCTGRLLIRP